jgi:hypothetical protein
MPARDERPAPRPAGDTDGSTANPPLAHLLSADLTDR